MSTSPNSVLVRRFVGGPLLTTCYAVIAPGSETILIDAPRNAWRSALDAADETGAPVSLVVLTHGHWDHIADASQLKEQGFPLAGHAADEPLFADPMGQRDNVPIVIEPVSLDRYLDEGDRISVGDCELHILHTPGHTPGSICLWLPELDTLFTGDTLLKGGAGYLDQPECDARALAATIERLGEMPEQTRVYPGHGGPTRIGREAWLADAANPDALIELWQSGRGRWGLRKSG